MNQLTDFTRLLKDVAAGLAQPEPQSCIAAEWIRTLKETHAMFYYMVIGYLKARPEDVIEALAFWDASVRVLKVHPVALRFVTLLQEKLRNET